jgi:DNA-binding response OmpR family regulator
MQEVSALVISDRPGTVGSIRKSLEPRATDLIEAHSGREGLRELFARRPDVVLLDLDLDGGNAWHVLERVREITDVPLMAVSESAAELEKARALRAGADDVMVAPIGSIELAARIEALMRRAKKSFSETYVDGLLEIDLERATVTVGGRPVMLTPLQYRVLIAFASNPDRVLSPSQLLDIAWRDANVGPHRVKTYVAYLRQTFREEIGVELPIETVRGFGYRYRAPARD